MLELPPQLRRRISEKVELYAANSVSLANQIKKLKGLDALRLRVGDYRVIFEQDDSALRIIKIGHRRDVYG